MKKRKPIVERMKVRPQELLSPEKMRNVTRDAYEHGMTVSTYLEKVVDPSEFWGGEERKMDAFTRVMAASGVIWRSDPASGIWADTYEDIARDDRTRGLIPEFARRVWMKTRVDGFVPQVHQSRFLITEDDEALGSAIRPIMTSAAEQRRAMEPLFGLQELIAFTNPIEGDAYRRVFLENADPDQVRLHRIGEAADIPRAKVTSSEKSVRIYKYGKALQLSYEALRNSPVDKVGLFIAQMSLQNEEDRITDAISTAINGDGTSNSAAQVHTSGSLVSGATALTYEVWLAFKAQFRRPYVMTHVFARTNEGVDLQMLSHPNTAVLFQGSDWANAIGAGSVQRINDIYGGVVRLGETDQVAANAYLGIDSRYALERVTQIGAEISENVRFIENQTELLTFTEVEGFAVLDEDAARILTVS